MDKIVPVIGLVVIVQLFGGGSWNTGTVTKIDDDYIFVDMGGYVKKIDPEEWVELAAEGKIMLPAEETAKKLNALRAEVDVANARLKDAYGEIDHLKDRVNDLESPQWEGKVIGVKANLKEDTIKIRVERGLGANVLPGGGTEVRVTLWQPSTPTHEAVKAYTDGVMSKAEPEAPVHVDTQDADGDEADRTRGKTPEWAIQFREAHEITSLPSEGEADEARGNTAEWMTRFEASRHERPPPTTYPFSIVACARVCLQENDSAHTWP